jgi:peroxiredoxin
MRARPILAILGFAAFAFFSFSLKREMRNNSASTLMIQRGMVAPDFQALDLNGHTVDLYETVKANKIVDIIFWATWCDPCRVELANLQKMYPGAKARGLELLAVNLDPQEIPNFAFVKELPFPILLDPGQTIAKQFGIRSLPSTVILDPNGTHRVLNSMEGSLGALFVANMQTRR